MNLTLILSKYITLLRFAYKAIHVVSSDLHSSRFIIDTPSFALRTFPTPIFVKLFLEKKYLI